VRSFVDEFVLINEEQVLQAIVFAWQNYSERIEGSAAAALAAVISGKITDRPAVVIISGGNIQPELFAESIFESDLKGS
jgi:threonine dehydratase